jgi:hypothetical protein
MKPKKRQKLCCHCEGEVDLDVIVCPYCAADLREEKPEQLNPPYNPSVRSLNAEKAASQSLYPSSIPEEAEPAAILEESAAPDRSQNIIGPLLLLTLGAQLLILGLLMALFSHKGSLVLKWDARMWFFYIIASGPLLFFGYRSASKL